MHISYETILLQRFQEMGHYSIYRGIKTPFLISTRNEWSVLILDIPYYMHTSYETIYATSDRGLGAVLTQEIEGEERPVLYISRKLSKRETMYSTIEKECLAIRWAVLTLRYYLLGWEFTLCSDHAPLQWLHRMKDTNARITRWYLALQPFKFKVIHRPGTQMTVADFLSRNGGGGGGACNYVFIVLKT